MHLKKKIEAHKKATDVCVNIKTLAKPGANLKHLNKLVTFEQIHQDAHPVSYTSLGPIHVIYKITTIYTLALVNHTSSELVNKHVHSLNPLV